MTLTSNKPSLTQNVLRNIDPADEHDFQLFYTEVKKFCDKEIAPIADDIEKNGEIPRELWNKMGQMGLLGLTVPEEYGGSDSGPVQQLIAMQLVSEACPSVGLSYIAHTNLCTDRILLNGTSEQKAKYLPKLVSGEHIGALAMSEPDSGSDVLGSMKTKATRKGNDAYIINGSKYWITNGGAADIVVLYAKSGEDQKGKPLVTTFIVEKGTEGFSPGQKIHKRTMPGSNTQELVFDDCEISAENVLGKADEGVYVLMKGLDSERLSISGGPLGIAVAALDLAIPYTMERTSFGKSVFNNQAVQFTLADAEASLDQSLAYAYSKAFAVQNDIKLEREIAASVFLKTTQMAVDVAHQARELHGGFGLTTDSRVGQYEDDAKLYETGAGTLNVRRMVIAQEMAKAYGHQVQPRRKFGAAAKVAKPEPSSEQDLGPVEDDKPNPASGSMG